MIYPIVRVSVRPVVLDIRTQCIAGLKNTASRLDKQYASERRLADDLKPGVDKCWINLDGINLKTLALKKAKRIKKLNPLWYGPFDILERTGVLSYRIKLPADKVNAGLHDVFHVMNIRKYDPNKFGDGGALAVVQARRAKARKRHRGRR